MNHTRGVREIRILGPPHLHNLILILFKNNLGRKERTCLKFGHILILISFLKSLLAKLR